MTLKRVLLIAGLALLAFIFWPTNEPIPAPLSASREIEPEPVPEATPVVALATPTPPPPLPTASASETERKIRETKTKREVGYKDLEHAFVSNRVCDFAEVQEKLPLEMTVKVLMSRGSAQADEKKLAESFNVITSSPKTEAGRFFKAVYLAGLDEAHPNPQADLRASEKILRALNVESPQNIAYIVFLYQVLKLKNDSLPDLVDELVGRNAYDPHVYEIKRELQMKGGTTTALHAASLVEKELPRPALVKIAELIENETRFAARDEAQALLASTERMLQTVEKRAPLALAQFPLNDELIPRKLNEAARNYLLMDGRDAKVTEIPPSLNRAVEELKREYDETGSETKACEKRTADDRYEWMKKHR